MSKGEAVVEAVSGAVGSILALLATYPLKTIYTLQALSDKQGTAVHSVVDIITRYRLQGLYVGIKPSIFESGLSSAVYFWLYSRLRQLAVQAKQQQQQQQSSSADSSGSTRNQSIGVVASLIVAAVAGVGNQLVTMPASVVITRMQAQQKRNMEACRSAAAPVSSTSVVSVMRDIWHERGLPGFWAGLLPALILVVNPAIQFMLYEQLLQLLRKWRDARRQAAQQKQAESTQADGASSGSDASFAQGSDPASKPSGQLSASEIFLASALAKVAATVLTYPMIVVKSRMQGASKADARQHGTLQIITRMLQEEGMGGFFKGLKAKMLQTALSAALMLMLKEQCFNVARSALAPDGFFASVTGRKESSKIPPSAAGGLLKAV